MRAHPQVIGFVTLFIGPEGVKHLAGTTLRMRWPGPAETWLDRLKETGFCTSWRPADAELGEPVEYGGARVFSCRRLPADAHGREHQLVAVWEGMC